MGRILQEVTLENAVDLYSGKKPVRRTTEKLLVDSGAAMVCLHKTVIDALGLPFKKVTRAMTADGLKDRNIYAAANIVIGARDGTFDVMEIPEGVPQLLGYIPMEQMDLVIDFTNHKLVGNPEHQGKLTIDLL